jgi:hypothetical protein
LLKDEHDKVIREEIEFRKNYKREPLLTWSVKNISFCFYKQSDTIQLFEA